MRHGSLFSGIGAPELAAEWMGWQNIFHCERNPFGQRVLNYYWPQSKCYEDITTTDFTIYRNTIDVLTGGFPCQPFSQAGKQLGTEDDRHLWPEMLRAIREIRPRWVVGENVRGLVNWNGGLVFDEVQADLEAEGYEIMPFLLPACALDAPHRRDRIWIVAYSNELRSKRRSANCSKQKETTAIRTNFHEQTLRSGSQQIITNTSCENGLCLCRSKTCSRIQNKEYCINSHACKNGIIANTNGIRFGTESNGIRKPGFFNKKSEGNDWRNFPTQSPVCDGNDGFSSKLDGITFSKWRTESLMAGGNAMVPQLVYQIFKAIQEYEKA